ncbi:transcriptional regulator PhoB [Psychromonas sp. CNPT3]|uniref:phosphate regulon transcriptional regulator PhoB n=1 Tax=Psychromonas sp. CNPT3 TaxID=314282 RepID=UPI0002C07906|nr:phosphate regulon transcriptional regulator PhoB [Psychromonas sp. CNPT3]AGH79994.1 transcriptional regulator PhoB [Psychromonas sp. CNPT3]
MLKRILVVEDEISIQEMICFCLQKNGFEVEAVRDYQNAVQKVSHQEFDIVLLDWMIIGGSGLRFINYLKSEPELCNIPVIMLTARSAEEDKVEGLDAGADDYMTKPFSPKELIARLSAVLRRGESFSQDSKIKINGLSLDPISYKVDVLGGTIKLGPLEFKLLHFFMTHIDRVYSRDQLLDRIWGTQTYIEDRTVDVHIRRLRSALSETGRDKHIQTVRGFGYRFSIEYN